MIPKPDVARLLAKKSDFVAVECPACGAGTAKPRFEKYTMTYKECSVCETVYVSPRPTPTQLADYYQQSENYAYWNDVIFPASENVRRARIFRPRVERVIDACRRHGTRTNVLLEIGAGFGTFCEEMKRVAVFDRIVAVEPTPDLAQTCRNRGLEVIERRIEDVVSLS